MIRRARARRLVWADFPRTRTRAVPDKQARESYRAIDSEAMVLIDLDPRAIEAIARSLRLLAVPVPDTFLGRKTQEPFPTE